MVVMLTVTVALVVAPPSVTGLPLTEHPIRADVGAVHVKFRVPL